MPTLILVRHAKSAWDDHDLADHDRPLDRRGSRDAPVMAERLAARAMRVDAVLTSTAVRAHTTATVFAERLGVAVEPNPDLYLADAATLFDAAAARGVDTVMVVAHDPGMSVLASRLAGGIPHMPTCAVATFTWHDGDWRDARSSAPDAYTYDIPKG